MLYNLNTIKVNIFGRVIAVPEKRLNKPGAEAGLAAKRWTISRDLNIKAIHLRWSPAVMSYSPDISVSAPLYGSLGTVS